MKTIRLKSREESGESLVSCRGKVLETVLPELIKEGQKQYFIFTDENVFRLYSNKLKKHLPTVNVHAMPAGEVHKTAETLLSLLEAMAGAGLRRNACLIALGGGVVGDIGGLAASLYMRGIDCIQVPTTLLAQVDSSVGGKTAVDFAGVKNLIGAFKQPSRVYVDSAFLKTLPSREIRCGLGEIIKHGALDSALFEFLWEHRKSLFDLNFLAEVVPQNIAYKAEIVRIDPHETGLRKCLNLGHTTGHAIELAEGTLSHGECVLLGLLFESRLAAHHLDCDEDFFRRLDALCLAALGRLPKLSVSVDEAARLALLDKKNTTEGKVVLTVPVRAGEYQLLELAFADYARELKEIWEELC